MSASRRLKICYVVPGSDLVATMGPTRNVLNLARAMRPLADVSVAFRRVSDRIAPEGLSILQIAPDATHDRADDAATSGMGYLEFLRYLREVRRFVARDLAGFDVILEKSWLLSGYVSALCASRGLPGIPVENIVQNPGHAARQQWTKLMRLKLGAWVARRNMQKAPVVIAETEFLKREIHQHWGVPEDRIAVVHLGVDGTLFRPIDQAEARRKLGLSSDALILTYVGVLDWTHNLEPAIKSLFGPSPQELELHVIGDGARRGEYESMSRDCPRKLRFYGKVPHADVPWHIAAADLCLAPYDSAAFASGELGYSTMKIPEYLSVGRAIVSVPSGRVRSLIENGRTGFLFPNEQADWRNFLGALPSRARLAEMGAAAAAAPQMTWESTAQAYYEVCVRALQAARAGRGD